MKKFLFIMMVVFLSSCTDNSVQKEYTTTEQFNKELVIPVVIDGDNENMHIIKYKVDGHDYQFHAIRPGYRTGIGGVVHDPQCSKCLGN